MIINLNKHECMTGIVYKATCNINKKIYIGVTSKSLNERINGHIKLSKRQNPKYLFNKAIKKYGIENFLFEKFDTFLSFDERDEKEMKYIKEYNSFYLNGPGYNMTLGGDGSRGHVKSPEAIEKIKIARAKQIFTKETRELWSRNRKGKKLSDETKQKISATCLKTGCHKMTEDTKQKLSNFWKGKTFLNRFGEERSNQIILKMSNSSKGKINIKHVKKDDEIFILKLYKENKFGLHKLCQQLKILGIDIGHSAVKRLLIKHGAYNINSSMRKNQYL